MKPLVQSWKVKNKKVSSGNQERMEKKSSFAARAGLNTNGVGLCRRSRLQMRLEVSLCHQSGLEMRPEVGLCHRSGLECDRRSTGAVEVDFRCDRS